MKTAPKKIRIAVLLLALAVGLLVRQSQKLSGTEDQPSVVNTVRAVAHLNLRRALKAHPSVTASNARTTNPQMPAATKSQEANLDEPQEGAVLSDSRPRNEAPRCTAAVEPEATGKEGKEEHWILFLSLRMRNDTVELISSCRSQGVLKAARNGKKVGPIDYDIVTATGESIWSENMEDPLIERTEFPVAENIVGLKKNHLKLNEVEFTLRVPWRKEACQLRFYRRQLIESPAGQQVDRRPLSSLTLPSYERSSL
jgi:hypothetical protein